MNLSQERSHKFGFIEWVVAAILFAQFTNLYVFIAGLLDIPFKIVGGGMLLFLAGYAVSRSNCAAHILRQSFARYYLIVFTLLPLLSSVYAPFFLVRYAIYTVLAGALFLVTCIWISRNGVRKLTYFLALSWAISVAGVVLSYFFPGVFEGSASQQTEVGIWNETRIATADAGRAFGFYMQPNRASLALVFQLILLRGLLLREKFILRFAVICLTFGAIVVTGSRGGIVLFFLAVICFVLNDLLLGVRKRGQRRSFFALVPHYFVFSLLLVLLMVGVYLLGRGSETTENAMARITSIVTQPDEFIRYDQSVLARLYAQEAYVDGIMRSPILGRGLAGAAIDQRVSARLPRSSHNSFLENAYDYGIPVAAAMYLLFLLISCSRISRSFRHHLGYELSWILLVFIFAGSFLQNTIIDHRLFPMVIAFWLSMLYSSHSLGFKRLHMQ